MNAQLHTLAKKAGLKYFGSASDIVDVKALDVTYAKILSDKKEFGQITPANGMKVFSLIITHSLFNWGWKQELKGMEMLTERIVVCSRAGTKRFQLQLWRCCFQVCEEE